MSSPLLPLCLLAASVAAAQTTATISGTIRHQGKPVVGLRIQVVSQGSSRFANTDADGVYRVTGAPTGGGWLQILVHPPVELRLAFRSWQTNGISGDLVKDFDLESGYLLSGEMRQPDGQLLARSVSLMANSFDRQPPAGEWVFGGIGQGRFALVLPPGRYALDINLPPYFSPPVVADLRSGDVTGLIITMLAQRGRPYPTVPPRAELITVGPPDEDGFATVSGAPGAVLGGAEVAVINLNSHTMALASAGPGGSFSARLHAPPGSAVMVKADPFISNAAAVWRDAQTGPSLPQDLNPLPGTIVYAGGTPGRQGAAQRFDSVGAFLAAPQRGWAGWWLSGTTELLPAGAGVGRRLRVTGRLRVTSPTMKCSTVSAPASWFGMNIVLHPLFAADGRPQPARNNAFRSYLFTPTGLPIERDVNANGRSLGMATPTAPVCAAAHTLEAAVDATLPVPEDFPAGIYLPRFMLSRPPIPLDPVMPVVSISNHFANEGQMPPLTLGAPAPARIPWTILSDYPVNGYRGASAREDAGWYSLVTRVMFAPYRTVIPRVDERTGEPLEYRLDAGSLWFGGSDRCQPNPPQLPLAFPSGQLTVRVEKPDGSIDVLGPAPIRQSAVTTPSTPGGAPYTGGSGSMGDVYHVSTMAEEFVYRFDRYGPHVLTLSGMVSDIYGNSYQIAGTYDVEVARVIDIDPGLLPTTPHLQGDVFNPGLHLFPPVPAEVTVRVTHMPNSDPARAVVRTVEGRANRFGYFQPPPGAEIRLDSAGEFRVDITATHEEPSSGTRWTGTMTWGNVVEGVNAQIEAHGRRGMDYQSDRVDDMPAWYEVANLPPDKIGSHHFYPYFSGDVAWGMKAITHLGPGESLRPGATFRDTSPGQKFYQILRDRWPRAGPLQGPPQDGSLAGLNKRLAIGEAPLLTTTASGAAPWAGSKDINLLGYWYGTSERPDVRVREVISEDSIGTAYWRFNDTYGYQIGEGARGDLPGDLKWEFGGVVLRVPGQGINEYAAYSSLWVLTPDSDPIGPRVSPPFQNATGASINGGPIMKLKGQDIDMLFLPKGIRPGDVLEAGDTVSFSGHVGPPLDSVVGVTIVAPGGEQRSRTFRANRIGWVYDPAFDFAASEPGRWRVYVAVLHDRPYVGNGVTPKSHNTGTVLGTEGSFEFYVVPGGGPRLEISAPAAGFISFPTGKVEPIPIRGTAPPGTSQVHYTIHDKGVVMGQGALTPNSEGSFTLIYDARALNAVFPFVSLTAREGMWEGLADEVAINFLAVGGDEIRANTVTLIGEEVFIGGDRQ
jgi:hypothetical protein